MVRSHSPIEMRKPSKCLSSKFWGRDGNNKSLYLSTMDDLVICLISLMLSHLFSLMIHKSPIVRILFLDHVAHLECNSKLHSIPFSFLYIGIV